MILVGYNVTGRGSGVVGGTTLTVELEDGSETFYIQGGPTWAGQLRHLIRDVCRWYMGSFGGPIVITLLGSSQGEDNELCGGFVIEGVPVLYLYSLPWILGHVMEEFRTFLLKNEGPKAEVEIISRAVGYRESTQYLTRHKDSFPHPIPVKVTVKNEGFRVISNQPDDCDEVAEETGPLLTPGTPGDTSSEDNDSPPAG